MSSNNAVNPNKTHFQVAHRLFELILEANVEKDIKIKHQWENLQEKAKQAGTDVPAQTRTNFSKKRPALYNLITKAPA